MRAAHGAHIYGFSLIELAIVLVIVGLLIGGGVVVLETTTERQQRGEQRQQLREVRDALYGYAMSRGHLPCPDTSDPPDGREDRDTDDDTCLAQEGALPSAVLATGHRDAWGNPLRYRVASNYAARPMDFDLQSAPATGISVYAEFDQQELIADDIAALVVSYGPAGGRIWTDDGYVCPGVDQGLSAEAGGNCDSASANFYSPGYRRDEGDGGFRQMLIWLPDTVFKARMIQAGRLP